MQLIKIGLTPSSAWQAEQIEVITHVTQVIECFEGDDGVSDEIAP